MMIQRLSYILACLTVSCQFLTAADGVQTDFKVASAEAATAQKDLLLEFTGSDWCPPCKALYANIFSKQDFITQAGKKFVLVKVDFPRNTPQEESVKAANQQLAQKYQIAGYPTVLLCDANGLAYGNMRYRSGMTVEQYLEGLDKLLAIKQQRDLAFTKAEALNGAEKAKALHEGLLAMGAEIPFMFYKDKINEIKKLDPTLELTFSKPQSPADQIRAMLDQLAKQDTPMGFMAGLSSRLISADAEQATAITKDAEAYLAKNPDLEPLHKQRILGLSAHAYRILKDQDAITKTLDQAIAIDPDAEYTKKLKSMKQKYKVQ